MKKEEFEQALIELALSQAAAARFLGVQANTVHRWMRGDRRVPGPVRAALTCLKEKRALETRQQFVSATWTGAVRKMA